IDTLRGIDAVAYVRVEDAPASRAEAAYNFISNEIFVGFVTASAGWRRWLPLRGRPAAPRLTLAGLETILAGVDGVGAPDYGDAHMLQFLHAERVVPPYQTRGFKIVELVRVYDLGA
ncbi:MAG TPA: hypothetical protein VFI22_12345, partial [Thermomicrobiales bacterium]|nr:hypothetical protein [Thermomicrobiales bacterium]